MTQRMNGKPGHIRPTRPELPKARHRGTDWRVTVQLFRTFRAVVRGFGHQPSFRDWPSARHLLRLTVVTPYRMERITGISSPASYRAGRVRSVPCGRSAGVGLHVGSAHVRRACGAFTGPQREIRFDSGRMHQAATAKTTVGVLWREPSGDS
jgi:hypothetical protein